MKYNIYSGIGLLSIKEREMYIEKYIKPRIGKVKELLDNDLNNDKSKV